MRKDLYRDLHIVGLGMLFCAAFGVSATAPGKAPLHVSFDRLPEKMTEDNCISKLNTSSRLNDIHKAAQKGDTATVETLLR
ncbi:MAG: hypothetical protein LBE95_02675, partial [Holosporaceae bacterium]|nr:hypothetical protein [Holosporaceae bacterium]